MISSIFLENNNLKSIILNKEGNLLYAVKVLAFFLALHKMHLEGD